MKTVGKKIISLKFNCIQYDIEKEKLTYILNFLSSDNKSEYSNDEIYKLLEKYNLSDEYFLKNINKLW